MLFKSLFRNQSQIARISKRNFWNWRIGWMFKPWPKKGTEGYRKRLLWTSILIPTCVVAPFYYLAWYFTGANVPLMLVSEDAYHEYHRKKHEARLLEDEKKNQEIIELARKRAANQEIIKSLENFELRK